MSLITSRLLCVNLFNIDFFFICNYFTIIVEQYLIKSIFSEMYFSGWENDKSFSLSLLEFLEYL